MVYNIDNYIQVNKDIDSYRSRFVTKSETYGEFVVTKVLTIDLIKACEDKQLSKVMDAYDKLRVGGGSFASIRTINIDKKLFGGENGQFLHKFDLYTAIDTENKDWVDPKGYLKSLPIAISKNELEKILKKLK